MIWGRILESVIKKDSLYPVFKRYIWKSRINYFSNKVLTNLKQVIKKIYNGFNSKQSNQKYKLSLYKDGHNNVHLFVYHSIDIKFSRSF